jgi:hypothetical protein
LSNTPQSFRSLLKVHKQWFWNGKQIPVWLVFISEIIFLIKKMQQKNWN